MKRETIAFSERNWQAAWLAIPVFLILFSPIIQLRFDFGPLSIASQEIPISLGIILLIAYQVSKWGQIKITLDPIVMIFIAYMFLSVILRPWSYLLDGVYSGFTDIRGWGCSRSCPGDDFRIDSNWLEKNITSLDIYRGLLLYCRNLSIHCRC